METPGVAEESLHLRAYAKVNLGLTVLGERADGFHEIETLFARIALSDELWLETADELTGELEPAETNLHGMEMNDDNLVLRAARAYLDAAQVSGGARLRLLKRIPVAAGLGGGSTDAAAALLGLSRLHPSGVRVETLAPALGSDVPFFAAGLGAAWAGGRGELIRPVELPRLALVLANPGVAVSAADAYRRLEGFDRPPILEDLLERLSSGREPGYVNSLQPAVLRHEPIVAEVLRELSASGLRGVLMSGSGPTCLGIADDEESAGRIASRLAERRPSWWVWSGTTV